MVNFQKAENNSESVKTCKLRKISKLISEPKESQNRSSKKTESKNISKLKSIFELKNISKFKTIFEEFLNRGKKDFRTKINLKPEKYLSHSIS